MNDSSRKRRRAAPIVLAGLLTLPIGGFVGIGLTEEGLPSIQRYGLELITYATVRRPDGSHRRMLATPDAIAELRSRGSVPNGTRILMETYYQPDQRSTVFHAMKQNGRWLYGSFNATVDLSVRPQASCLSCHAGAAKTDFTYTLPSLKALASGKAPSDFACERNGRSPCALDHYAAAAEN